MFLRRSATVLARQARLANPIATRSFVVSAIQRSSGHGHAQPDVKVDRSKLKTLDEIKTDADLLPPGAPVGTMPTDLNQSTGLERLELLGKMQGVDVFDMRPLDASRKGTMEDPIVVNSVGEEHYVGCTGYPVDSHVTNWMTISRDRPIERCDECGNVIKMNYVGPEDPHHGHPPHKFEPDTMADFIKPDYFYK